MHALHIILGTCPENGTLYLSLLNITLEQRLYHESEALLDAILDYAFETSSSSSPRISNHRRFLVDLYYNWITRFPSSTFVRLTTAALRRASSDSVWTSKATRRLVRKLVRYDHAVLSIITDGLRGAISTHKSASKPVSSLDEQLRDWLYFCVEVCTSPIRLTSEGLLSLQHQELLDTIVEHHRSCSYQTGTEDCDGNLPLHIHGDAVVCLYSLWLASGSRQPSPDDSLHTQVQQYSPPSSTFALLCSHLLRTKSLSECEEILVVLSSIFMNHNLPRLDASLWACALSHTEEKEIEQILIGKNERDSVRDFRSRLADCVDEAEKECFAPSRNGLISDEAPEISNQDLDITSNWCWEASVECWFQKNARTQRDIQATPKRRKISHLSPHKPILPRSFRCSVTSTARNSASEESLLCFSTQNLDELKESFGNTSNTREAPASFISLLSNALSSRTSLRIEHHKAIQDDLSDDSRAVSEEMDWNDDDSDTDDISIDHATSEDHLDLFRIPGTSPLQAL